MQNGSVFKRGKTWTYQYRFHGRWRTHGGYLTKNECADALYRALHGPPLVAVPDETPAEQLFRSRRNGRKMLVFDSNMLRVLWNPCVYVFYHGDQCLYVGSSRRGARPFDSKHHIADRLTAADRLLVYPMRNRKAAFQLESDIIAKLSPLHNVRKKRKSSLGDVRTAQPRFDVISL